MRSQTMKRILKEVELVKIGWNKNCIREHLAKEKMVFSKESSRAIFEMGNVELIDLKKSPIQCTSCFTTFLKERSLRNDTGAILPCISDFHKE